MHPLTGQRLPIFVDSQEDFGELNAEGKPVVNAVLGKALLVFLISLNLSRTNLSSFLSSYSQILNFFQAEKISVITRY